MTRRLDPSAQPQIKASGFVRPARLNRDAGSSRLHVLNTGEPPTPPHPKSPMFWAGETFNDNDARQVMHYDDIILPPGEVRGNVESKHAVQLPVRAKIEGTK